MAAWLGLDRAVDGAALDPLDREQPGAVLLVGPPPLAAVEPDPKALADGTWSGTPNPLSRAHVRGDGMAEAAEAARKPPTPPAAHAAASLPPLPASPAVPAATLLRQRRSRLGLDGRTALEAGTLYGLLDHLLPRVRGLPPGLYLFERDPAAHEALRAALAGAFAWEPLAARPGHLPLYLLAAGDCRERARGVSCHQEVVADGAFSVGMLARFADGIQERGAWWYRRLFWEAGVLGQALSLEAEAAGLRGTGIGCYFDDAFHDLLGLAGDRFQSLYHFTAGGAVEDLRLRTLAPYAHLGDRGSR